MARILSLFAILLFTAQVQAVKTKAYDIRNGFFVISKELDFTKSLRNGQCSGKIPYPYLTNEDEELFIEINEEVHDFAEIYSICNEGTRDNYDVQYEIPESGNVDYFSIIWKTTKDGKLYRIDTLNFDRNQGDLMKLHQIFNEIGTGMLSEIAKISEDHLPSGMSWSEFSEKINSRDVQLYAKEGKWEIVFNPTKQTDKLTVVELPNYFLKGNDVTNTR